MAVSFVFAGQGAQAVGMGKSLYVALPKVKALFDMAEAKQPGLLDIMFNGAKEQLDMTINTQPAMFLVGLACAYAQEAQGIYATGVAGFSLGEISALCYAGWLDESQAFDLVRKRAEFMQSCAEKNPGNMFAVLKLPNEQIETICAEVGEAWAVNYNCPGQTVVACAVESVNALAEAVTAAGGRAMKLPVSGAFHSPFMTEASEKMAQYLESVTFNTPKLPLYANATAQIYDDPKALLARQINSPVLWQKTVETMLDDGFDTFVEVGPGKVLTGLIAKIKEKQA
ncbi:MAG: ACP S-malonyltransferase [Oscillospiraceae bacterium]|nr:ACP S-malonyltransferase [Oscillospiraceae bacterium]